MGAGRGAVRPDDERDPLARPQRLQRLGARVGGADRPLPAPRAAGRAQGRLRRHRARRRLGPVADRGHRPPNRRRLPPQRREVVRHLGRPRRRLRGDGQPDRRRRAAADPVRRRPRARRDRGRRQSRASPTAIPTGTRRSASTTSRSDPDDVIGEVGGGNDLQRAWFIEERLAIAARCCGAMWRLLDETVAWATSRQQGGARIYDHQGVSFPLADSAADATAGRTLTFAVAELADAGGDPKLVHHKASIAKLFTSEAAWRCADRCVQAFGGRGYLRSNVAERLLRELRVDRIWEGTSEIQRLIVATGARAPRRRGDTSLTTMDLAPLLAPRSIAVVGATDRRDSYGGNVLRNLDRAGYAGEVWGVNPKRDEVLGRACFPAVDALPEPVDALVVAVPAVDVAPVVRAGAERGCGGAIVLSAGFAESESGVAHEAELRAVATAHRPAGLRPERERDRRRRFPGGDLGRRARPDPAGPGGDDHAERERRRERPRFPARDRLAHGGLDRKPDRLHGERLAGGGGRARRRRLGGAVPGVRRRRRQARRRARDLRRARRRRRGAEGRQLGGRRPSRRRPHGVAGRRPAGVPDAGRGGGSARGPRISTTCSSSPRRSPSHGRAPVGRAASRSSPARAATPGSPAIARPTSAWTCRRSRIPPSPASASCFPTRRRSPTRSTTPR